MLRKIWFYLLLVYLFILPWQTRWIYDPKMLNESFWEYGSASIYLSEIVLWGVIILYFADRFSRREVRHLFGKYHWSVHRYQAFFAFGFIAFLLFSVFHSQNVSLSYDYFFHLITLLCLFVILGNIQEKKWLMTAAWAGGVVQGSLAIVQFMTQKVVANKWLGLALHSPDQLGSFVIESGGGRWLRAYGSFGSPNILGGYLAVMLVVGLILYLASRPVEKIYLTFGQVMIFIGLVFSFSRGAFLAAAFGVLMVGVSVLRTSLDQAVPWYSRFHPIGMYIKQCIFYTLVLTALIPVLGPMFKVRLGGEGRLEQRSFKERTSQYFEAISLSKEHPWFGVGPGVYTAELARLLPGRPAYEYQPVHNSFLLLFVEWGSVGAALWLALFGTLLAFVKKQNSAFIPVIFVMFISAAFDHFWWSLPGGIALWWMMFGLAL